MEEDYSFPLPNNITPEQRAEYVRKLSEKLKYSQHGVLNPEHIKAVEEELKERERIKNEKKE
jgi:hypothetical protein